MAIRHRVVRPRTLPTGAVTFLFSDIEGSTRLAQALAADTWAGLLQTHDQLVDAAVGGHGGVVVKHEGDGTFAVFRAPSDALEAAAALSAAIAAERWPEGTPERAVRVRIGLHAGDGRLTTGGGDYVGIDVHYAARLAAVGNGGQIVVSDTARRGLTRDLPARATLVAEGPRTVKDFAEPRPVHRLVLPGVADDDRPLRTLAGADLPEPLTSFVGRAAEVEAIQALVERSRIVTLTGPGGTGKTRLCLSAAAAERASFPEGVCFVELSPVRDPGLVAGAVAAALGVAEAPGQPTIEVLRAARSDRRLLFVLDNLEQLLPAVATVVADLARALPLAHLLASSREPLRIAGEQEYRVPPLAEADAAALFVDRALLVRPDLDPEGRDAAPIAGIVRRVDGLPLAVELAAARARLFKPAEILDRLGRSFDLLAAGARDLPERQRTLRATVAWSHDLLGPPEQVVFRRLAVLEDEWDEETAQAVVDPGGELGTDVLDGLASLVDKSLLRTIPTEEGPTRFGRHVFVREFAAEMLTASGEREACERRHAEVFRDVAVAIGPRLTESSSQQAVRDLDGAIHDLRRAMTWSLEVGEPTLGLEIVGSCWRWWQIRSHLAEGRDWARRLLDHPAAAADSSQRIDGLAALGGLAYWASDRPVVRAAYEERLALAERLGDPARLAEARYDYGFVGMLEQDLALLREQSEQALALFEQLGDRSGVSKTRQVLVLAHLLAGEYDVAQDLEERNLADFERTQAWYRISDSRMLLAAILWRKGAADAALASARAAIRALQDPVGGSTIASLAVVALALVDLGDTETAARLTGAIRAVQAATGEALASVQVLHLPDPEDVVRARLDAARADALLADGAELGIARARVLALGDEVAAEVAPPD